MRLKIILAFVGTVLGVSGFASVAIAQEADPVAPLSRELSYQPMPSLTEDARITTEPVLIAAQAQPTLERRRFIDQTYRLPGTAADYSPHEVRPNSRAVIAPSRQTSAGPSSLVTMRSGAGFGQILFTPDKATEPTIALPIPVKLRR